MDKIIQLRKAQIYIAKEIKRVCDLNGIQYFLDWGSLLGAIRHKGFIPWDDDMDISMLKDDYEKFISIAPSQLNSDFYLDEHRTNEKCTIPYAKVKLRGTKYIEEKGNTTGDNNEIFVDVFPYFSWPQKGVKKTVESIILSSFCHAISAKFGVKPWKGESMKKRICFFPTLVLGKVVPRRCLWNVVDYYYNKYSDSESYSALDGTRSTLMKYSVSKDLFSDFDQTKFEEQWFSIPKEYDMILRLEYGDYMKIPPENERRTHNIQELDLGEYSFK